MLDTLPRFQDFSRNIMELRYSEIVGGKKETWEEICSRVVGEVLKAPKNRGELNIPRRVIHEIEYAMRQRKFIPGGRMLSNAGKKYHQTDNCFMMRAKDTREGWAELAYATTMMFMSGGGVGIDYSDIRCYGSKLKSAGGIASGPLPLLQMVNSIGAAARQGGERRGAIYGSLKWDHEDVNEFIKLKDNGGLEHTNISVRFDREWANAQMNLFNNNPSKTHKSYSVFMDTLRHAVKYGDPGFQFDADNQILRNACTEIISADSYDSCCLGSVNLSRIESLDELRAVSELGTVFLLAATMYTDVPVDKVRVVKDRNRRLGLGLMGIGEWFIQRGFEYGHDGTDECRGNNFEKWLEDYKVASDDAAVSWSYKFNIASPIAVRAIAPNGTISIAGGMTTPGIEPVFHTAYERTYNTLKDKVYNNGLRTEKVVDPIVVKWIEQGYDVRDIDTAYTLSQDIKGIERRIKFQALVQKYVDNGISSTVNLPRYTEGLEDKIAPILLEYLPQLRGITFYPDGARDNQPVVAVDINDVLDGGAELHEAEVCQGGVCNI